MEGAEGESAANICMQASAPPPAPSFATALQGTELSDAVPVSDLTGDRTPPTSMEDSFSAALQQLDAHDAELRAACADINETKGLLKQLQLEEEEGQQQ